MSKDIVAASVATEIDRLHRAAQASAGEALRFAKQAGDLLVDMKAKLPHGKFLRWLKANCEVSARQSQRYMRLASNWTELSANATSPTHLSELGIDGALERLATPRPKRRAQALPETAGSPDNYEYPELLPGHTAFCYTKADVGELGYIIFESGKSPGFWYIVDMIRSTMTVRPMKPEGVRYALQQDDVGPWQLSAVENLLPELEEAMIAERIKSLTSSPADGLERVKAAILGLDRIAREYTAAGFGIAELKAAVREALTPEEYAEFATDLPNAVAFMERVLAAYPADEPRKFAFSRACPDCDGSGCSTCGGGYDRDAA